MTADQITKGAFAFIEDLIPSELTLHLMEMGFLPGKRIELLHQAPLQGPMAFKLENSVIALRHSEAMLIQVQMDH
ncbi:MAG TPA: FeoA family protein [Cyclobacteriaceae bacterium]|nr:FeoA family protein [Cyclobacteriaceae bacterium]